MLKPRPPFAPEAAVMELDSALLRAELPGSVLQSARTGPASVAMIAAIEAENTIRCKVIANPPFKANIPRSRQDSRSLGRYDAKVVGELSRRANADCYYRTIIMLSEFLLNY
jgi:hypothetical protein